MHLQRIKIRDFKNLKDVEIHFREMFERGPNDPPAQAAKPIRSHALIGQNGTGKSNLIEALITIFRDIDLNRDAAFDYTLEYSIRGHVVRIQADVKKQKRPFVWVDGDKVSQDYLTKNDPPDHVPRDERRGPRLLPAHVFAYYSGRNERIEELFQEHQRRFIDRQEITTDEVLSGETLENFPRQDELFALEVQLRKFEGINEEEMTKEERAVFQNIHSELSPLQDAKAQWLKGAERRQQT